MGNTNETENTRHSIQVAIYLTIWDYGETALRTYLWLQVNWSEHLFICMHNPREGQTRIDALKPRLCMGCFFLLVLYFRTYLFQLIFLLSTYHLKLLNATLAKELKNISKIYRCDRWWQPSPLIFLLHVPLQPEEGLKGIDKTNHAH